MSEPRRSKPCGYVATAYLVAWMLRPVLLSAGSDLIIPKPTDYHLPHPPPPAVDASVVNLTIGTTIQEVSEAVENAIPVHHEHENQWIPGKQQLNGIPFEYQYYLWRGPVEVKTENGLLVIDFPDVRYRVRVRLEEPDGSLRIAECGYGPDAHMRMRIKATSDVQWAPGWTFHTTTRFGSPQYGAPCRLEPLALDITPMLNEWFNARLPVLAATIDRLYVKHAETKKRAQLVWNKLQEPMELTPGTWLVYRPRNPRAGSLTMDRDQSIHTVVSMAFDPAIVVGGKPYVENSPLPILQMGPIEQEGFHLGVPLLVPYEELDRQLAKEIVGQEIDLPVGAAIRITGIRTYGSGRYLISEVALAGGMNGKLYLQGEPAIAADGRIMEFNNLDFTIETSNVLAKLIRRTMYNAIREKIIENMRIEVGDLIESLRRMVENRMNRELATGIWLQGTVSKIEPRGVYPVRGGIEAQLTMDGSFQLLIP